MHKQTEHCDPQKKVSLRKNDYDQQAFQAGNFGSSMNYRIA
jgi:hypothetical protein